MDTTIPSGWKCSVFASSTISPEFEDTKASYKSVFFDENGKPYIDWQAKSQQMKKLLKDLGTLTRRYNKLASNFDIIQRKLSDLTRPEEVKKAPKYFGTWLNISLLIGLVFNNNNPFHWAWGPYHANSTEMVFY